MKAKSKYIFILILIVGLGLYLISETIELSKYKKDLIPNSEMPQVVLNQWIMSISLQIQYKIRYVS